MVNQKIIYLLLMAGLLSACSNKGNQSLTQQQEVALLLQGDSIASQAQSSLLNQVTSAMQKGGPDSAIAFCHVNAMPLTESTSLRHKTFIQRLSDKNRNPANAIINQTDSVAWLKMKAEKTNFILRQKDGDVYYYKPIIIAIPACLQCHGGKTDILASTQKSITQKYPNDLAMGYNMGDLRGMWKIKLKETPK